MKKIEQKKFFTITFFPTTDSAVLSGYNIWAKSMLDAIEKHYKLHPNIEPNYIHYKPEIKE